MTDMTTEEMEANIILLAEAIVLLCGSADAAGLAEFKVKNEAALAKAVAVLATE